MLFTLIVCVGVLVMIAATQHNVGIFVYEFNKVFGSNFIQNPNMFTEATPELLIANCERLTMVLANLYTHLSLFINLSLLFGIGFLASVV